MKIGIEVEFFGAKDNHLIDCSDFEIPHDEWPILAEARGNPSWDVYQAVGSVLGAINRIKSIMAQKQILPIFENWAKRDYKMEEKLLRKGVHKQISYQNLYLKSPSKKNRNFWAAGMHVSLTDERTINIPNQNPQTFNRLFDFATIFHQITKEFLFEIQSAGRVEGFYEVKGDGRIEYRSLPTSLIFMDSFPSRLEKCIVIN